MFQDIDRVFPSNLIRLQKYNSLEQTHSLIEYSKRCFFALTIFRPRRINSELVCEGIELRFGKDGEEISTCIRLACITFELRECHRTQWEIDYYITKILKLKDFDYLTVPLTCAIIYSDYGRFSKVRDQLLPKLQDNSDKYYVTRCTLFPCSTICLKSGTIKEYLPRLPSSMGRHKFPVPVWQMVAIQHGAIKLNRSKFK
jgi:hypothetical protein